MGGKLKVGQKVKVLAEIAPHLGYDENWKRVKITNPGVNIEYEYCDAHVSQIEVMPEELPTAVGSIVLLSDCLNELVLQRPNVWTVLGDKAVQEFKKDWVIDAGFTVVLDRGSDGAE